MTDEKNPAVAVPPLNRQRLAALVDQLRTLSPRRRLNLLLDQPDLTAVLARLPIQDVHALIREVGAADTMELIEACPPAVLQGLVDLGCWTADRVDPRALANFYAALFQAEPDVAIQKVLRMDPELRTLFLKLHVRVEDITEDGVPDAGGADHLITPDHKQILIFGDAPGLPEAQEDPFGLGERGRSLARHAAKEMLEGFLKLDPAGVTQMMDAVRWELPSQLEDDALRWRSARMMDLGFPPREEALRVLAFLDPDKAALRPPAPPLPPVDDEDDEIADQALALYAEPDDGPREPFLAAGIAALSPPERDRVKRELASVANMVAVARSASPGDPDAIRGAVRETRITLDLGLAYRGGGKAETAVDLLRTTSLVDLFRVGHSLGLRLQRQAQRIASAERGTPREIAAMLDPPWGLAVAALLGRQPLFFTGLARHGEVDTHPFASLDDLAVAARAVAEAGFRLAVGLDVLGVTPERLRRAALEGTNLGDAAEVTLEVLLTTALARAATGGRLDPSPLDARELQAVRAALSDAGPVERAGHQLGDLVAAKAPLPGARKPEDAHRRAAMLAGVLLTRLDDELHGIPKDQAVDARFVTRVLTRVG
ncbi:MAG: hypothetical protein HY904_08255 [Deltaproteobacteria bacterium]|nr:hypothetical protein [Deltaproteobacteria bacterium]